MTAFLLYLLLFLGLIYYTGFFGLADDNVVSRKQMSFLFLIKALAVPVFYFVYQNIYGGVEKFDSGKFYHDAQLLNQIAYRDFTSYLKILLGFQNERSTSYDFLLLKDTLNWDNGAVKDYLYNDNRVVIRIHSLFHFLSFNSYFVHALFSCFLSFIGCVYVYKTFKDYFKGKELLMLILLCFFPALWFYSGGLLKEGITFFILGLMLYQLKQVVSGIVVFKKVLFLIPTFFLAAFLKPYLLLPAFVLFASFFILEKQQKFKSRFLTMLLFLGCFFFALNSLSVFVGKRSLYSIAVTRQTVFSEAAQGGIFLSDNTTFIQLPFDTALIQKAEGKPGYYTIKKGVPYSYWKAGGEAEKQLHALNKDSLRPYQLLDKVAPSKSNIDLSAYTHKPISLVAAAFYYSLAYPLFFNAHSPIMYLASFENFLVLLSLFFLARHLPKKEKSRFLPLTFLLFSVGICLLVGLTSPNSGAIFRYRSPALVFLLLSVLYYLEPLKMRFFKRSH